MDSINKNSMSSRRLNEITKCSEFGTCQRSDGVLLLPGFQAKTKIETSMLNNTQFKQILSIDPFQNSTQLQYITNSNTYVCADGLNECINSCCNKGMCNDPSNTCSLFEIIGDRSIYIPCIAYLIVVLVYWGIFVYLGIKYNKKSVTIVIDKDKDQCKKNDFEDVFNEDFGQNYYPSYDYKRHKPTEREEYDYETKKQSPISKKTNNDSVNVGKILNNAKESSSQKEFLKPGNFPINDSPKCKIEDNYINNQSPQNNTGMMSKEPLQSQTVYNNDQKYNNNAFCKDNNFNNNINDKSHSNLNNNQNNFKKPLDKSASIQNNFKEKFPDDELDNNIRPNLQRGSENFNDATTNNSNNFLFKTGKNVLGSLVLSNSTNAFLNPGKFNNNQKESVEIITGNIEMIGGVEGNERVNDIQLNKNINNPMKNKENDLSKNIIKENQKQNNEINEEEGKENENEKIKKSDNNEKNSKESEVCVKDEINKDEELRIDTHNDSIDMQKINEFK